MDEFQLIRRYFTGIGTARDAVALDIGDDCALLKPVAGEQLAITSDTLVAGRHFPQDTSPFDIGWKSLAVNLSDLAAMGAQPLAFTLALTLPAVDEDWLQAFSAGLRELAEGAGIPLVGGDTTRGPLSITITALGSVAVGAALRRDGAQVGDLVCVTGTLGDAALALQQSQGSDGSAETLEPWLLQRLNRPQPRLSAGVALRGIAHAAIDLSDGLAGDLSHILRASGLGAEIDVARLPASALFAKTVSGLEPRLALQAAGGDDYELCLCIPPSQLEAAISACGELPLTVIGRIVSAPGLRFMDASGAIILLPPHGYRHFS